MDLEMNKRVWKSEFGLSSLCIILDKKQTSQLELVHKSFELANKFGYVSEIEIQAGLNREFGYTEHINKQSTNQISSISDLSIESREPSSKLISFIQGHEAQQLDFQLGTVCHDLSDQLLLFNHAATLTLFTESDEEDWALYIDLNTDIFAPLNWEEDPVAAELARLNAPKIKQLIDQALKSLPAVSAEWKFDYSNIEEYITTKL